MFKYVKLLTGTCLCIVKMLCIFGSSAALSASICDIGIADFTTITRNPELAEYTRAIPTLIFTHLANSQRLSLVNRQDLDKILDEMGLKDIGIVDPQTAAKVGHAVGAKYMFIGQLSVFQGKRGSRIWITTQLVHVESVKAIGGWKIAASPTELDIKAVELARNILARLFPLNPYGAAGLSTLVPGWGQCANKRADNNKSCYVFFPLAITSLVALAGSQHAYNKAYDEYIEMYNRESKTEAEMTAAENKYNDRKTLRRIACAAVAGVWTANVADAFIRAHILSKYRLRAESNVQLQTRIDPQTAQVLLSARF